MTSGGLVLDRVSTGYGLIQALWGVSLTVELGEVVALIGSNGAGKTTALRTISGGLRVWDGSITYKGQPLLGRGPDGVVKLGIAHAPEGRRIFGNLSVRDNLTLGTYARGRGSEAEARELVYDLFPVLRDRERQLAATMSGGEQQMLAVGRALMSKPEVLLLDEPSLGIAPKLVLRLFEVLSEVRKYATILLVEQNIALALSFADRGYVLENGRVILKGSSKELLDNEFVAQAYMGHELAGAGRTKAAHQHVKEQPS